jgi:hypothetical protein
MTFQEELDTVIRLLEGEEVLRVLDNVRMGTSLEKISSESGIGRPTLYSIINTRNLKHVSTGTIVKLLAYLS